MADDSSQAQQPGPQLAMMDCPKCQAPVRVIVPLAHIINEPGVSFLYAVHQIPAKCQKCGVFIVPKMHTADNVVWHFEVVEPQESRRVELAPPGLKLPRAN